MSTTQTTSALDIAELKRCFAHYPSGVVAVTGIVEGHYEVFVASSFAVGISLEPALVSLAVRKESGTWAQLEKAEVLGLNVLGEGQTKACLQLAGKDRLKRFEGLSHNVTPAQTVRLDDAAAFMEGTIWKSIDAGDHVLILIQLSTVETNHETEPLVYHSASFRKLEQA